MPHRAGCAWFFNSLLGRVPDRHQKVYEAERGYTFEDWNHYRNPNWRFRPEPILTLREASGYWQQLMMVAIISVLTCCYFVYLVPLGAPGDFINNFGSLFSMATFAVSLLMVFKLNNTYARWWEARKQWGNILESMRNYLRLMVIWTVPEAQFVVEAAARWAPAAMLLLKEHVRESQEGIAACKDLLSASELAYLEQHANKPLAAAHVMSHLSAQAGMDSMLQAQVQEQVSIFVYTAAGNERILRTPIPTGYTRFTSRACMMYICIIPVLLWPTTGWMTPIVALIISFVILGVENVGVQIEEPFRVLHLEALCASMGQAAKDLKPWSGFAIADALQLEICKQMKYKGDVTDVVVTLDPGLASEEASGDSCIVAESAPSLLAVEMHRAVSGRRQQEELGYSVRAITHQ